MNDLAFRCGDDNRKSDAERMETVLYVALDAIRVAAILYQVILT
jgi:hypothetical protein